MHFQRVREAARCLTYSCYSCIRSDLSYLLKALRHSIYDCHVRLFAENE